MMRSRSDKSTIRKRRQRCLRFERCEPRLLLSSETAIVAFDSGTFDYIGVGDSNGSSPAFYSIVDGRIVLQPYDEARIIAGAGATAIDFIQFNHSADVVSSGETYDVGGFSAQWIRTANHLLINDGFDFRGNLSALRGGAEEIARITPVIDPIGEPVREPAADRPMGPATDPAGETVGDSNRPQFLDLAGIWESMSDTDVDDSFAMARNAIETNWAPSSSSRVATGPADELTRVGSADALGRAGYFELAGASESTTPQLKLASRSIIRQVGGSTHAPREIALNADRTEVQVGAQRFEASGSQPVDAANAESWLIEPAETVLSDIESSSDNVEQPNDASPPPAREPLSRSEPLSNLRRGAWWVASLAALLSVDRYLRRSNTVAKSPPDA